MTSNLPLDVVRIIANNTSNIATKINLICSCKQYYNELGNLCSHWKTVNHPYDSIPLPQLIGQQIALQIMAMKPKEIHISYKINTHDYTGISDSENSNDYHVYHREYYDHVVLCDLLKCTHDNCKLRKIILACDSFSPINILTFILTLTPLDVEVNININPYVSEDARCVHKAWYRSFYPAKFSDSKINIPLYLPTTSHYSTFVDRFHFAWRRALKRSDTHRWLPRRLRSCNPEILQYIDEKWRKNQTNPIGNCHDRYPACKWWNCICNYPQKNHSRYKSQEALDQYINHFSRCGYGWFTHDPL